MSADFEQIVGDARRWLRTSRLQPWFSRRDGELGVWRQANHMIEGPLTHVRATERQLVFPPAVRGSLLVTYMESTSPSIHNLRWDEKGIRVKSSLTQHPHDYVPVVSIPPDIRDRIEPQMSIPLLRIIREIQ